MKDFEKKTWIDWLSNLANIRITREQMEKAESLRTDEMIKVLANK
jgi:hypothetical protein